MNYLDVNNPIPVSINFINIPPTSNATCKTSTPFMISISAIDTNPHVIDLYAQYSKSHVYQTPQQKWSHLIPQWRFLDSDGNVINQITTTDTAIYSGTEIIGATGYASFDFIDDYGTPFGEPLILWATMQVSALPLSSESYNGRFNLPSYANSKVITYIPFYVNQLVPYELHITRNGIDEMSITPYWIDKNVPAIITLHSELNTLSCLDAADVGNNMVYWYPSSNELGYDMGVIEKTITTIPTGNQNWTTLGDITTAAYFQAFDLEGFDIIGYSRNIVVSDVETLNTNITAGVNVKFATPYVNTPFIWVSHPNSNLLYKFYSPYVSQTVIDAITAWLETQNFDVESTFITPFLTQKIDIMSLTGFGGIYGIAVDPCYNVWCSDSEMDNLYKFSYDGTLLSTIDLGEGSILSAIGVSGGCTPAGISLDSNTGLWVSLFDSASVLKIDRTTGVLITAINPYGNQTSPIDGFGIDIDYKPTLVETDKEDNVWVSFTNTLCSYLYKYDDVGNLLTTVTLPTCSNPMDILIDYDNSVWATLTFHSGPPYLQGSVIHLDTNGNSISTFSLSHPEYLTLDKNDNVWVTYGFNNVTKITPTGQVSSFTIGTVVVPTWYNPISTLEYNCLEGIACDSANRIWVINSYENTMYVLSGDQVINTHTLTDNKTDWYLDTDLSIKSMTNSWYKSIQAFGDWSGIRWLQKYNTEAVLLSTFTRYITGISDTFNIYSFSGLDIRKFNESWDATTQIRNYALPEHLYDNYNLFINYIGTMIGGLETSANSIGRLIYERTANFVENHGDVDTANIPQLYSLANKINVPIDEYSYEFPADLKRIMDIVSIPHKVLWGDRCKCALNFRDGYSLCKNCGHKHDTNRGSSIYTDTYVVSTNIPFLAEYKFGRDVYELITPLNSSINIYAIASGYLLNDPIDYCYYQYIATPCNVQIEGIINWDDEYTTLSETNSSLEEWYGKGQLVEKMISYYLHKGLGF